MTERLVAETMEDVPPPFKPPDDGFDRLIGDAELGVVERIFLLRRTIAFKNANVNSIARLVRRMRELRAAPGEVIWRPGDRADSNLFIVKGRMQTSWKNSKGEPRLQELGPGYVVGGGESMAGKPRWNELVALEPAVMLEGTREALVDMFEDDLEAAKTFLSLLSTFLLASWDRKAEREAKAEASAA